MIKRIIKEPLLHFALLGGLTFALYWIESGESVQPEKRIIVSEQDVERHIALFERKWQRLPSRSELSGLLESDIREEILYREALKLGLDRDDAIVRRRLAQKMEFISADISDMLNPTDKELQDYLEQHPAEFLIPPRYSLEQVYLNPDRRAETLDADADALLMQLRSSDSAEYQRLGDPMMLPQRVDDIDTAGITREFGPEFSATLGSAPLGEWYGPVRSNFGVHLVRIVRMRPGRDASLADVREAVEQKWRHAQREQTETDFYQSLRQEYEVILAPPAPDSVEPDEVTSK